MTQVKLNGNYYKSLKLMIRVYQDPELIIKELIERVAKSQTKEIKCQWLDILFNYMFNDGINYTLKNNQIWKQIIPLKLADLKREGYNNADLYLKIYDRKNTLFNDDPIKVFEELKIE